MHSFKREFHEKRNYIRMKVDTPVAVKVAASDTTIEGTCRDLSGGGMLVELESALPVGAKTEVAISSSHGHEPILKAKADVMRVISQPDVSPQTCMLGLQITEVLN